MELFPGLPSDLGRHCLLKVPYKSHQNLTSVCRSWKVTVKSPKFYQDRKALRTSQQIICLLEVREDLEYVVTVYDPIQGSWETLPNFPHFPGCYDRIPQYVDCISVNQRLVLIGGYNPSKEEDVNTVFIYNLSSGKWSRGADMPIVRTCGCLIVSPEGLVYIAGGIDSDENALRGAAVYDVDANEWKLLPDMSQEKVNCHADFIDGKLFVIGNEPDDDLVEVYDPQRGSWTTIQKEEGPIRSDGGLACSVGARSFWVQMQQGVMEYDSKEKVWRAVCSLPNTIEEFTSCVAWRDKIFVSGYATVTRAGLFYMFTPPPVSSEAGAQGESFGKWDAIERLQRCQVGNVKSHIELAVTVEI